MDITSVLERLSDGRLADARTSVAETYVKWPGHTEVPGLFRYGWVENALALENAKTPGTAVPGVLDFERYS